jgi:hypothetical protein
VAATREGPVTRTVHRPCARSEGLIVEELGAELLVYDMEADRGHCLSPTAARVWRRCDGHTPSDELSARLDLEPDAVNRALEELAACKLLESTPELTVVAGNVQGATRREVATKFVKAGAVAAAAPLIVSVAAPTPAQAQTLLFCAQFNSDQGCGSCQQAGCCCCTPANFASKLCVPPNQVGIAVCCAAFGAGTVFSAGCPPHAPCGGAATESTERQFEGQQPATSGTAPKPGTAPAPEPASPPAPEPTPVPEAPPPDTTTTTTPTTTTTTPDTGATGTDAAPTP